MVINFSKKILFLNLIFLIGFVSASFSLGNASHFIETSYGTGQNLTGWVNISFNNEPGNSAIKISENNYINLFDLLNKKSNSAFVYNCTPSTCSSGFVESNEASSKTFNLAAGQSALFGFRIFGGTLSDITSFKFNFVSNNSESNIFPLSIDILGNGDYEWEAYSISENYGTETFGCYVNTVGQDKAKIASVNYCERVELERAPAVEIGAYVNYVERTVNIPFDLKIEEINGGRAQTCSVTATGTGRISCIPNNFDIPETGDYYVCIKAKNTADSNNYEINYEQENSCGFTGSYEGVYDYDFEIFARLKNFAGNINFTFDNNELDKAGSSISSIESHMENYVADNYNRDCSKGCVIPIKIVAGVNQQITVSNLRMVYVTGISRETNGFYDVSQQPAKINSGYQLMYLTEAGLKVPDEEGDYAVLVSLNDDELFEEFINVGKVPEIDYVTPLRTAIKYPTEFSTKVTSDSNITQYQWNFGDGNTQSTSVNKISYTYENAGIYNLILTVRNSAGQTSSKTFEVKISPASEVVPTILQTVSESIKTLEDGFNSFAGFKKTSIQKAFDVDALKDQILVLNDLNTRAATEQDYEKILQELLKLNIPRSLSETSTGAGITFYPAKENINLEILKEVGGGTYSSSNANDYQEAILSWEVLNMNVNLSFTEISAIYDEREETAVRLFELNVKKNGNDSAYFIIKNMENLLFAEDYPFIEVEGYKYLQLDDGIQTIYFSTTEDLNFLTLPIFISPSLGEITIAQWSPYTEEGGLKKWIIFTIVTIGVLFAAFVLYIVLQIWYKRKYESYLFKDRNNLYNLVNYVKSSRDKGVKNNDIEENLKKTGWSSEQVRYVMKKFENKNTGMPEIPIRKLLKEKEKKMKTEKTSIESQKL